jgi:hypothetical protein
MYSYWKTKNLNQLAGASLSFFSKKIYTVGKFALRQVDKRAGLYYYYYYF